MSYRIKYITVEVIAWVVFSIICHCCHRKIIIVFMGLSCGLLLELGSCLFSLGSCLGSRRPGRSLSRELLLLPELVKESGRAGSIQSRRGRF